MVATLLRWVGTKKGGYDIKHLNYCYTPHKMQGNLGNEIFLKTITNVGETVLLFLIPFKSQRGWVFHLHQQFREIPYFDVKK